VQKPKDTEGEFVIWRWTRSRLCRVSFWGYGSEGPFSRGL